MLNNATEVQMSDDAIEISPSLRGALVDLGPAPADWVAIVANPYSGNGANQKIVAGLQQALEALGLASRTLWDPIERKQVLGDRHWRATCRCVVVAGGDGTVADVLNQTTRLPVAMVPIGNENLFARQFGYRDPKQIAQAVARGNTRRIDLGQANDQLFAMMVSVGLDADVVDRVSRWRARSGKMRRISRLSYVRPMLGSVIGYDYPPITLTTEDQVVCGRHVAVFNIPQYAMGLPFVPEAKDDDGLLHWVMFEKPGVLALGGYMTCLALGRHLRCRSVQHGTARRIQISSQTPAAVQIDGDAAGMTPVDVRIVPRAVDVILPDV